MLVVKADVSADNAARPIHVAELSLTVDALCLDDAVDPFRHGCLLSTGRKPDDTRE